MSGEKESQSKGEEKSRDKDIDSVVIRSWPKAVLLYPLLGASVLFGFLSMGSAPEKSSGTMGLVFLIILGVNLFVMTFEFNRIKSIALFFFVVAFIFAALFISAKTDISILGWLREAMAGVKAWANSSFYFGVAIVLGVLFIFMFAHTRINYWEVTSNELIHHRGMLGDVERFPAPNVRITKEINDIFEFGLLWSGSLVIVPASEKKAIILETVPRINEVERKLKAVLSEIAVDIKGD